MSATYLQMKVSDKSLCWEELNSVILLDPYTHFINKVLSEVVESDVNEKPTFALVYDVMFHGADFGSELQALNFRFYAHGLMVEAEHLDGVRYTLEENILFEDGKFYNASEFDWARLGDLHTIISFIQQSPEWEVYLDVHLGDSDPIARLPSLETALLEATRLAMIDGRAYTVVTPDEDNITIEHT